MSKKNEVSRRQFLSRTALTLPVAAAAIPAAMDLTSPMTANAGAYPSVRQFIPDRPVPSLTIGSTTLWMPGSALPDNEKDDCSAAIQDYIDNHLPGGGTLIIPWKGTSKKSPDVDYSNGTAKCIYMIDLQRDGDIDTAHPVNTVNWAIKLKDNVRLVFEPGVTLKALPMNTQSSSSLHSRRAYMIYCANLSNVEILNANLVGERDQHIYSGLSTGTGIGTDEWVYGINIAGSSDINIIGTHVSDFTGDGIQVGRLNNIDSSDVMICNCVSTRNRRQAISLTGCSNVQLYDSEFTYTSGTAPQNGIDIEPQGQGSVSGIDINNCIVRGNSGDGIEMNASVRPIGNVDIKNCLFEHNYWNGIAAHGASTVTGGTIYGCAFFQNGKNGMYLGDTTGFIIGAVATDGSGNFTNSFANNWVGSDQATYPVSATVPHTDYYTPGHGMNTDNPSNNTWQTNVFPS